MTATTNRTRLSWSARLLIGLVLVLAGAGAMTWALANYPPMARVLGVANAPPPARAQAAAALPAAGAPNSTNNAQAPAPTTNQIAQVEARVARVEDLSQHAAGSAGRADALVIAFAARRAIDRGVALGYLENLLVQRFGAQHQAAVATTITAARNPLRLSDLVVQYEGLGPALRRGSPKANWWSSLSYELGSLVEVHSAERPSGDPDARYQRARQHLSMGNADMALAETMRMPGAANATDWIARTRRYVATQRALDEIESAALLGGGRTD
ncbi:MAG: hypothetical protein ACREBK_00160 [Sphingomicrobium sp.]